MAEIIEITEDIIEIVEGTIEWAIDTPVVFVFIAIAIIIAVISIFKKLAF